MIALLSLSVALAQTPCTVLLSEDAARPGVIWTVDGALEGGALRIEGARIAAVGAADAVGGSAGCARVDISGRTVTAGFVAVGTSMGVTEVGAEAATNDHDAGGDAVRASLRVVDAYNPRATAIPVTRVGGVTSAVVYPTGGLVSGQAGWVDLAGATQTEAVRMSAVGLVVSPRGSSRADAWRRLEELFDDAAFLDRRGADFDRGSARPLSAGRLDLAAIQRVRRGELPLIVQSDRAADLEVALRFAAAHDVRLIVHGGAEAWLVADALAAAGVPVVLDPMVYGPGSFDAVHGRRDNAALLAAAGVPVLLAVNSTHNARLVPQMAGDAVRSGLPWEDALLAVTERPARAFGLDEHGALAVGRRANVVVWRSLDDAPRPDPFELSTVVDAVWIGGASVPLTSRQTLLHERYATQPGAPLDPLPLPEPTSAP